jgi:hypothetical protein
MIEVYYFISTKDVENAVECGLKLSQWFDKEAIIFGEQRKCISALLNPKDDLEKYKSDAFTCLKIEMAINDCFIGDNALYQMGMQFPQVMDLYHKEIIMMEKYIFGSFRMPECLISSTIISDQISILDKWIDSPVIFGDSEDLYTTKMIEGYKDNQKEFYDTLIYHYYNHLTQEGMAQKVESLQSGMAVFVEKESGNVVTTRIPKSPKNG